MADKQKKNMMKSHTYKLFSNENAEIPTSWIAFDSILPILQFVTAKV